jgi:VIT1/CCC1 family predicted Fe2+/Mn2+ transporter
MGLSEALSDDGTLTGRGTSAFRGLITGIATFIGGTAHALPFLIDDLGTALPVAYAVVTAELVAIAWVRKRFLQVALGRSLIQVTVGGAVVATVGILVGQAQRSAGGALLPFSTGHGAVFLCPRARFMGPVGLLQKVIGYDPAKGR